MDKLPAGTIFQRLRVRNQARSRLDLSLHCTTVQGLQTIQEYNSAKDLVVNVPLGHCVYVLYVKGRQMSGQFPVTDGSAITLTVFGDRVAVH